MLNQTLGAGMAILVVPGSDSIREVRRLAYDKKHGSSTLCKLISHIVEYRQPSAMFSC
jgi:hypothetical protein